MGYSFAKLCVTYSERGDTPAKKAQRKAANEKIREDELNSLRSQIEVWAKEGTSDPDEVQLKLQDDEQALPREHTQVINQLKAHIDSVKEHFAEQVRGLQQVQQQQQTAI